MAQWLLLNKKADFNAIAQTYGIDPVIARIMRNREVKEPEEIEDFLRGNMAGLHSWKLLKDSEKAVEILSKKIREQKNIRIIGDYDVDGICSTFILKKGLTLCGAKVDTAIPDRITDGYGINEQLITQAVADKIDTIVTCDNGIAAREAFISAKEAGLTCIVTDHHEVPFEEAKEVKHYLLPEVDAIVDPKQEDCSYPFQGICGAFVAYKLIEGMLTEFEVDKKHCKELLELAGLATVCDVMELREENRILVKNAIEYMKVSDNPGLRALIRVCKLEADKLSAYHMGFILGPCLNATGRLDTANIALELLESASLEEAIPKAEHLRALNESRKEMTEQGIKEAYEEIEKNGLSQDQVLVVFLPKLHESLAGIVAGRVREKYGKPTFILTRGEEGIKGSARSIESYDIYREMTGCKELFTKYGGHKMAAGLSMGEENVEAFRKKINAGCTLTPKDFEEKIRIDVPMPMSYVSEELICQLSLLEPFGLGNEKPVFAQRKLTFLQGRRMGKNGDMARFTVADEEGKQYQLLLFRGLEQFICYVDEKYGADRGEVLLGTEFETEAKQPVVLDVLYYPSINVYQGKSSVQFTMQGYR